MNRISKMLWVIPVLLVWMGSVPALATVTQFSADMITESSGQSAQSKLYVGDKKVRMEMPEAVMISRIDKNVAWILMPEEKMVMQHPLDPKVLKQTSTELAGEAERKSLGQDNVNGVAAEKFQVSYLENGKTESVYQWIGQGGVLVKVADINGSWSTEYRNIQPGPQPDSLFEVPSDYQTFAMPSMGQ